MSLERLMGQKKSLLFYGVSQMTLLGVLANYAKVYIAFSRFTCIPTLQKLSAFT